MPRLRTKEQLLSQTQESFDRLFSLIEPLSSEEGQISRKLCTVHESIAGCS